MSSGADVDEWWDGFFEDPGWQGVQLGWDALEGEASAEQAEKIVRALRLEPGMRVLDAPCGTGRIAMVKAGSRIARESADQGSSFAAHL